VKIIKDNPKTTTGIGAIALAVIVNFGTISNELQEWFYMAKGEGSKPSSEKNISDAKFSDKTDYFQQNASKK